MKRSDIIMGKKKVLALLLTAVTVFGIGCGGNSNDDNVSVGDRPAGEKIVIYAGGSSEFAWTQGSKEQEVIDYIEQKYYEDTGKSIDFEIAYLGQNMKSKLASELAGDSQVDVAISHTRGGDGIDDWAMEQGQYYEGLGDLIDEVAPNLKAAITKSTLGDGSVSTPLDSMTNYLGEVIGIPSVINPYKFGILVRKDLMEACGYTDDAEKAASGNMELVDNLETFEQMCLAIKEKTQQAYVVSGAAWDWEKVLVLGAYTDAGAFTSAMFDLDGDGEKESYLSGGASPEYAKVLDLEYRWATSGIVNPSGSETMLEQGEAEFISGKTAVFVQDPTITHLIKVARLTKEQNPDAEFTVLGPLVATKGAEKKGFMRNSESTFAAVVLKNSTKAVQLLQFLNWVYKNEDNYNLCRYGVEGEHWIDNGDGTYSYPEGSGYDVRPAYSGILTLVENQNMSNLVNKGYTEEEMHWIKDIAGNPDNYIQNDVVDYLFVTTPDMRSIRASIQIFPIQNSAWKGSSNPSEIRSDGLTNYEYISGVYRTKMLSVNEDYKTQYLFMRDERMRG